MQQHSRRARRMEMHHKRHSRNATLNMVSLMDIFTILVFFLLVSSTTVQDIPNAKQIKLPESIADKLPKETVVIMVSSEDILVQGNKIASLRDVMRSKDDSISALKNALDAQAKRVLVQANPDPSKPINRDVTIMGDKEIPYQVLKKIMFTCTQANYGNISLAVLRKNQQSG